MSSHSPEAMFDLIMKNKTKPVHEVRLGHIKAAVWKNGNRSRINGCCSGKPISRNDVESGGIQQ